jgi:hypothetical protein
MRHPGAVSSGVYSGWSDDAFGVGGEHPLLERSAPFSSASTSLALRPRVTGRELRRAADRARAMQGVPQGGYRAWSEGGRSSAFEGFHGDFVALATQRSGTRRLAPLPFVARSRCGGGGRLRLADGCGRRSRRGSFARRGCWSRSRPPEPGLARRGAGGLGLIAAPRTCCGNMAKSTTVSSSVGRPLAAHSSRYFSMRGSSRSAGRSVDRLLARLLFDDLREHRRDRSGRACGRICRGRCPGGWQIIFQRPNFTFIIAWVPTIWEVGVTSGIQPRPRARPESRA